MAESTVLLTPENIRISNQRRVGVQVNLLLTLKECKKLSALKYHKRISNFWCVGRLQGRLFHGRSLLMTIYFLLSLQTADSDVSMVRLVTSFNKATSTINTMTEKQNGDRTII